MKDINRGTHTCLSFKRPRHTLKSRKEATRRERIRVQQLRMAYRSLQIILNIPKSGQPKYIQILQTAVRYIKILHEKLATSFQQKRIKEELTG